MNRRDREEGTMKKPLKVLFVVFALVLTATAAQAAGTSVTLKGGYFSPSDAVFRDVYGGGPTLGLEIAVPVAGVLQAWAGAGLFSKKGLTTESEEATKVRIVPLYAGLRCQFAGKNIRPYIGAAAGYFLIREENPLGTASDGGIGFLGQAGLIIGLGRSLGLDVHAGYSACTITTDGDDPVEAKLGGFSAGLGLSFRF
jgi:hypothetical protein